MITLLLLGITLLLLAALWFTTKIVFKIILGIVLLPFLLTSLIMFADTIICVLIVMGVIKLVTRNKDGKKTSRRKRR
jgi:hypothetical protein